jgi:CheY-like chemotaxis protein
MIAQLADEERMDNAAADRALILVVERDPHVRELDQYFLEEAGYAVEFAEDGLAALEQWPRSTRTS